MIKQAIIIIVFGIIGYFLIVPAAAQLLKAEFEDAGAGGTSVFDLFDSNQDQQD